jgi:hypothetical protein
VKKSENLEKVGGYHKSLWPIIWVFRKQRLTRQSSQTKLTADRISSLASLFEVPENEFFETAEGPVFNNNKIMYAYINNFVESQKNAYEGVIEVLKEQIRMANEEKAALIELLKSK